MACSVLRLGPRDLLEPIGADSNTYRYSFGDSVNFSDPSGLVPCRDGWEGSSSCAGGPVQHHGGESRVRCNKPSPAGQASFEFFGYCLTTGCLFSEALEPIERLVRTPRYPGTGNDNRDCGGKQCKGPAEEPKKPEEKKKEETNEAEEEKEESSRPCGSTAGAHRTFALDSTMSVFVGRDLAGSFTRLLTDGTVGGAYGALVQGPTPLQYAASGFGRQAARLGAAALYTPLELGVSAVAVGTGSFIIGGAGFATGSVVGSVVYGGVSGAIDDFGDLMADQPCKP